MSEKEVPVVKASQTLKCHAVALACKHGPNLKIYNGNTGQPTCACAGQHVGAHVDGVACSLQIVEMKVINCSLD